MSQEAVRSLPIVTDADWIISAVQFLVNFQYPGSNFPWTKQTHCLLAVNLKGGYSSITYFSGLQSNGFFRSWKHLKIMLDRRSISSPLPEYLQTISKGCCQVVVISNSRSLSKGYLHFCLSSGLDYCNSLLTSLHNRAPHSLNRLCLLVCVFCCWCWVFLEEKGDDLNILC